MSDFKKLPSIDDLVARLEVVQQDSLERLRREAVAAVAELRQLHDTLGGSLKLEGNELLARSSVAEVTDIEIYAPPHDHQPAALFRMYLETSRGQFNLLSGTTRSLEPGMYRVLTFFVKMPDSGDRT